MNIVNIMLSPDKGGLQQMSVVYALAMQKKGHNVICVMRQGSPYIEILQSKGIKVYIYNFCKWCKLWQMFIFADFFKKNKIDIAVCHGRRAISVISNNIIKFFIKSDYKIIGVMHSRKCKIKDKCDKLIFLTKLQLSKEADYIQNKSYILPNTILDDGETVNKLHFPVTSGALGRLHKIKGYDVLLKALAILKNKKHQFKFLLAGCGP